MTSKIWARPLRTSRRNLATLRRAGMIAPMRPDRYLRIAAAMRREGMGIDVGFRRCGAALPGPARPGRRTRHLTWRQLDERCDALAAALQALPPGQAGTPRVIGIMCRNHRGFIEAWWREPDRHRPPAAQHVVRRPGAGRRGHPRRRRRRHLRRGVHRDGGPRTRRQGRTPPASWRGPTGRTS